MDREVQRVQQDLGGRQLLLALQCRYCLAVQLGRLLQQNQVDLQDLLFQQGPLHLENPVVQAFHCLIQQGQLAQVVQLARARQHFLLDQEARRDLASPQACTISPARMQRHRSNIAATTSLQHVLAT
jgi:hypothetical protein